MKSFRMLIAAVLIALPAAGCVVTPQTAMAQAELDSEAREALADAVASDPHAAQVIDSALSIAVFPHIGRGALVLGAAYGSGVYYVHGNLAGFCDVNQASLGLAIGGEAYTEIVCLLTPDAVARFEGDVYSLNAQASAVAFTFGKVAHDAYSNDVAIFVRDEAGLMLDASIGVQEYRYKPLWTPKAH